MKRKRLFLPVLLIFTLAFVLSACGTGATDSQASSQTVDSQSTVSVESATESTSEAPAPTPVANSETVASEAEAPESSEIADEDTSTGGKTLIAYFSKTGNTQTVADMIADSTGGELFLVETVDSYPESYDETVEIAAEELEQNARPALSTHVEDMSQYDVIYVGYPIWWGTMPMSMYTFLEEYDLSGKTIIPFATHAGSGMGTSQEDLTALLPDSTVLEGIAISGSRAADAQADVEAWVDGLDVQG